MKKNKFKFIGVFISVLILILFFVLSQFNKEHIDVKTTNASLVIDIDDILNDYETDEEQANQKYTDNIIQVKGMISEIATKDGNATVVLESPNFDANVHCSFLSDENLNVLKFKVGDEISLKGICTGYLLDIVIVKCVIIKESN